MTKSRGLALLSWIMVAALLATCAFAQESSVRGAISALITDPQNAVVTDAQVTVIGPTGSKTFTTGSDGRAAVPSLAPGTYTVKIEKKGFKIAQVNGVEVASGKTSALTVKMDIGGAAGETVEVRADAVSVDTTSTATGTNLNDAFYASVPIARNVGALFSAAPGVVSGGGTGSSNPSIGGSSGLENLYMADGVNIGNSAYNGLGVYTAGYGSIGTGINLSFVKEVNVKTAGFEAQYGQATGGVVQIVTKSGSNAYHGAIDVEAAPVWAKARGLYRDDVRVNKVGIGGVNNLNAANYDASVELGGYVPGFRNHIFFFGSFNPTYEDRNVTAPAAVAPLIGTDHHWLFRKMNYDGKLTFKLNDQHQIEASIFGDPTNTNTDRIYKTELVPNTTGYSSMSYGTRNMVGRYNGTLSPTWLVNASGSWSHNYFGEAPSADVTQVVDRTTSTATLQGFGLLTNYISNTWAFNIDTQKVVKGFGGSHTFSVGYRWENPNYDQVKQRSGPRVAVPQTNYLGGAISGIGPTAGHNFDSQWYLRTTTAADCPICPIWAPAQAATPGVASAYLALNRGEFGAGGLIPTNGTYQALYATDTWAIGRHINFTGGIRWEQQFVNGTTDKYTFTDNWAPRIGVTVDPVGDGKTKLFANYARYNYTIPLDAAVRTLSQELDLSNLYVVPAINGTAFTALADAAHTLNNTGTLGTFGGVSTFTSGGGEGFAAGTKMTYEDEFSFGAEREYKGIAFSARYIDRRLKRIIEDVGSASPEGSLGPVAANSTIANPSTSLDLFVNEQQFTGGLTAGTVLGTVTKDTSGATPVYTVVTTPAFAAAAAKGCRLPAATATNLEGITGAKDNVNSTATSLVTNYSVTGARDASGNVFTTGAICFPNDATAGAFGSDGIADGFVNPVRNYSAFEFEANKSFSKGYLFRLNYRWAKLNGNYEGAFRNDNGQSDPGISSLFDFTAGQYNLLGNQFAVGPLNTDRRHVVNGFFSYTFDHSMVKGLQLGTSIHVQQGNPLQLLGNHPIYNNAGEVPVGGRGSLGRTPVTGTVDLKAEYPWKISERFTLKTGANLFNIANSVRPTVVDQSNALAASPVGSNPDSLKPFTYQIPFYARFSVRLEF